MAAAPGVKKGLQVGATVQLQRRFLHPKAEADRLASKPEYYVNHLRVTGFEVRRAASQTCMCVILRYQADNPSNVPELHANPIHCTLVAPAAAQTAPPPPTAGMLNRHILCFSNSA